MRNTCLITFSNKFNQEKLLSSIKEMKAENVFVKFRNDFFYEEYESSVKEIFKYLHEQKKKILIVLKNEFFIDDSDAFIVYEYDIITDHLLELLQNSNKPVLFKLSGPASQINEHFKELTEKIRNRFLSLYKFCFLLDPTDTSFELSVDPKICYLIDTPFCISSRLGMRNTNRVFLDVCEVIERNEYCDPTETFQHIGSQFLKTRECASCKNNKNCFGRSKKRQESLKALSDNVNIPYYSIEQIIWSLNSKFSIGSFSFSGNIDFETEEDQLTRKEIEILQNCRKGKLGDFDFYHVWSFDKSMYFNRHLDPVPLFNKDPRGINSIDMTFIGQDIPELHYKLKQDLVLPHHGVMIVSKIKFDSSWSEERMKKLDDFTMNTIIRIIIENGGDSSCIEQRGNDLLYNGKKFCGKEWKFFPPYGYIENTVLTTEYLPEKQWFDQLYHYDGEKQITGITDEVPSVTKELLISELVHIVKETFND